MINIIYYKRLSDDYVDQLKDYFREGKDFNIIVLNNSAKFREDIERYEPRILILDHNMAMEKNYFIIKQLLKLDPSIYVIVAIPDFVTENGLELLGLDMPRDIRLCG